MKYIGLDLHKKNIFATVLSQEGKILSKANMGSKRQDIQYYLKGIGKKEEISIAMEASYNWLYYYRTVEELSDNIVLAHPLKTRIIGEAKIKTDKIDSKVLAYMLRADMLPRAYVPNKVSMENKILLRNRISLVRIRTQIKNKIHVIIDRNRDYYQCLENLTDVFGSAGINMLKCVKIPSPDRIILAGYLDLIDEIGKKIKELDSEIAKKSLCDRDIDLLKSIPGIGNITAFLIKSEIDDIKRFSSKEKLCSYAGLVPSTHQSGDRCYQGRITKQGNKFLRWALTEAAQISIRCSPFFRCHYNKIRAKRNHNQAIIAVARKMTEIVYIILKEGNPYIERPINLFQMATL
ncbi:MAG: IS110 family RNA-guided transposase [Candidatus Humimicrobiaceae bacterium]